VEGTIHIPLKELPSNGKAIKLDVEGEEIAIFRVGDEVFAVGNVCPHQHFSRIHEGTLEGLVVTCPMHGWSFDLRSGACVNGSGSLKRYKVTHRGNLMFLELPVP
jgi:nitrite reductase/ring-hydroxylating ferredoxin subunit